MPADKSDVQNRLDQSMNGGTPQINPDEQRKFLGTFRERVDLAIPVSEIKDQQAIDQLAQEIKKHPDYLLTINGNLPTDEQSPYMKLAAQNSVRFTLKNDSIYGTKPNQYGVVFSAPASIHKEQIDFTPTKETDETNASRSDAHKPKESFLSKLFHK